MREAFEEPGTPLERADHDSAYYPGFRQSEPAQFHDDTVFLPTLHIDKPADPADRTPFPSHLNLVSLYKDNERSVVRIQGRKEKNVDGRQVETEVTGTGFFVTPDGKLATAYHVVRDADDLQIRTTDGRTFKATVEQVDPATDLAIMKVERSSPFQTFQVLPLGQSGSSLERGSDVVALGYPRGWMDMFVSPGRFTATRLLRDVLPEIKGGLMQGEDANRLVLEHQIHVQNGNSGGPVLDSRGRVIGVIGLSNSQNKAEATPVEDLARLLNRTQKLTAGTRVTDLELFSYQKAAPGRSAATATGGLQFGTPEAKLATPERSPAPVIPPASDGWVRLKNETPGSDRIPYPGHTIVHGVNVFSKLHTLGAGKPGLAGGLLSAAAGGYDLIFNDWSAFRSSLSNGSSGEIFKSGLQLTADTLLIGGGLASMSSRTFVPGAVASLAGSAIKVVSDGVGYTKLLK